MDRPRMRPLFCLQLPFEGSLLMAALRDALSRDDSPVIGLALRRHVELTVRPNARHFWSPYLSLDVLEDSEGTLLRGRYAPHPHLWMFIMAVHGVLSLAMIGACVYGYSQWALGWTPSAFWALPPCAAGIAGTWLMSSIGQRLAEPQMRQLESFVEDCLLRASQPPVPTPAPPQAISASP